MPAIYKPLFFIFLVVVAPGITDAMFYFQTDVLGFTPSNFALINVVSSIASIVGVWAYRVFFKGISLRAYMVVVTVIYSIVQGTNLILAEQKTQNWLRMTPAQFCEVNTFAYSLINELHLMPLMVIACQMCPRDVEATFYALVLAIINLGYLISYWLGGLLTIWLNISSDDFTNFWILILVSSLWPLATLLYLLVLPKES